MAYIRNTWQSFSQRNTEPGGGFIAIASSSDHVAERKEQIRTARESACEEFLTCIFIHDLDNNRYAHLKKNQHSSYLVGKSIYTGILIDAKKLLEEWKGAGEKLVNQHYNQQ